MAGIFHGGRGGRRGKESHVKEAGMFVASFRRVNYRFCYQLEGPGGNALVFR